MSAPVPKTSRNISLFARNQAAPARTSASMSNRITRRSVVTMGNGLFLLLDIEPEVYDIAVLNDVFFAFQTELALLAAAGFAPQLDHILEADDFSPYETALDVGMNRARSAVRRRPCSIDPRAIVLDRMSKS